MKIQCHPKDYQIIRAFLAKWTPEDSRYSALLATEESEGFFFDCSPEELSNCFDTLMKEGFRQSAKRVFQGDHFYRSDTGKCPRCYRHRPEIHADNENMPEREHKICDRCLYFIAPREGA